MSTGRAETQPPSPSKWIEVQVGREFSCRHPSLLPTVYASERGDVCYPLQCARCGEIVDYLRLDRGDTVPEGAEMLPPFDKPLWQDLRERREARIEELVREEGRRERGRAEWRRRYDAYMNSPEWRAIRGLVLERAGGMCEGCGIRRAVQVHHLTYEHLGDEFLWELRAVCVRCHERVHDKEGRP
jgi:hypothetical protein